MATDGFAKRLARPLLVATTSEEHCCYPKGRKGRASAPGEVVEQRIVDTSESGQQKTATLWVGGRIPARQQARVIRYIAVRIC